jgi:hypothetical protein
MRGDEGCEKHETALSLGFDGKSEWNSDRR